MSDQHPARVDEDLRVFLRDNVDSFEALEVLLLLRRQSERAWTASEVANTLGLRDSDAKDVLASLWEGRVLRIEEPRANARYAYCPADSHLQNMVERLARAYDGSRIDILRAMSTNAVERGERAALRLFADAFVLGRKKDG